MVLVLDTGRSWVGSWGLVDLTFFLASLSWPFSVARLFGRFFDMSSAVSPGHVEKLPLLIAVINVVGTGEKSGAVVIHREIWICGHGEGVVC